MSFFVLGHGRIGISEGARFKVVSRICGTIPSNKRYSRYERAPELARSGPSAPTLEIAQLAPKITRGPYRDWLGGSLRGPLIANHFVHTVPCQFSENKQKGDTRAIYGMFYCILSIHV